MDGSSSRGRGKSGEGRHGNFSHTDMIRCVLLRCVVGVVLSLGPVFGADSEQRKAPEVNGLKGIRVERDLRYVEGGDPAQSLDVYLPETPSADALPLIVHIHGGGWRGGSKSPCPFSGMVHGGYVVASVEYRFSQKALFPAQIQDCQAAIRWLRGNAKRFGINPAKVGVIGASAGGHLSALVGTSGGRKIFEAIGGFVEESDRVQAVCDIFGPSDFSTVVKQAELDRNVRNIFKFNTPSDPYSSLVGGSLEDAGLTSKVSPVRHVSELTPPFLILHGTHDALVPIAQSEQLADVLKAQGVPVWFQRFAGAGHGGPVFSRPAVTALVQRFFSKFLKDTASEIRTVAEEEVTVDPVVK